MFLLGHYFSLFFSNPNRQEAERLHGVSAGDTLLWSGGRSLSHSLVSSLLRCFGGVIFFRQHAPTWRRSGYILLRVLLVFGHERVDPELQSGHLRRFAQVSENWDFVSFFLDCAFVPF